MVGSPKVVAHMGFEPMISSLRGKCPKPLDECALRNTLICAPPEQDLQTQVYKKGRLEVNCRKSLPFRNRQFSGTGK